MKIFTSAILICLLFSRCASIASGSMYPLDIYSDPSGAEVIVEDKYGGLYANGITPFRVTLNSGHNYFGKAKYLIRFYKEGYEPMAIPLKFSLDGWYFGNLLAGGVIGMLIVDPITGAMWQLNQESVEATLKPLLEESPTIEILPCTK